MIRDLPAIQKNDRGDGVDQNCDGLDLLDDAEREMFAHLGVFVGTLGVTVTATVAVSVPPWPSAIA